MQVQTGDPEQCLACGHLADQVDHGAVAGRARRAERHPENRPQVVLELAGGAALDGPVAGVVYARGHLVGDQTALAHEELDVEHADVAEVLQAAGEVIDRAAVPASRAVGCAGHPQNALSVNVAVQRIENGFTPRAARSDDRHFALERHPFLVDQRHAAEAQPGPLEVLVRADAHLALAVVAHAACLEDPRQTDLAHRALELSARADRAPARGGNLEPLEQTLLGDAVLGGGERRDRRTDARAARAGGMLAQRLDGDVLPVEGQHLTILREPLQHLRIGERCMDHGGDLAGRGLPRGIEEEKVEPERITGERQHAAELAAADDADRHERTARGSGCARTAAV